MEKWQDVVPHLQCFFIHSVFLYSGSRHEPNHNLNLSHARCDGDKIFSTYLALIVQLQNPSTSHSWSKSSLLVYASIQKLIRNRRCFVWPFRHNQSYNSQRSPRRRSLCFVFFFFYLNDLLPRIACISRGMFGSTFDFKKGLLWIVSSCHVSAVTWVVVMVMVASNRSSGRRL